MSVREALAKFVIIETRKRSAPATRTADASPSDGPADSPRSTPAMSADAATIAPPIADGIDFSAIYEQAGIVPLGFGAEQSLQMLARLPVELPATAKRQTVRAMLDSVSAPLGVTTATLVGDASRKIEALKAFADLTAKRAHNDIVATEAEIASLKDQILERQRFVEETRRRQEFSILKYRAEADRLASLLEFFGPDSGG